MASSILESSEEKIYGFKLMRLIVDGGTEALRKVFLSIHTGKLHHVLAAHYSTLFPLYNPKKIITQPQWDKLHPHPPKMPNIQEFDITILTVLLRNICGLSAPSTGWNAMPSSTDKSREANIVRIKLFRNSFFGHVPGTAVSRLDFEARWVEVCSALLGLGLTQVEIDKLKAEECGEEEVNRVRKKWSQSEKEIVSKLEGFEKILKDTLSHESSKQVKSSSDHILSESLHWCDFDDDIELLFERYTEGTREWVFDQVLTWLNDESSTNRAFIISGQAGMGKSIIAAVICKRFPKYFAACHFFQYNNSRYNNSNLLLQSLAWQLSEVFASYKEELSAKLSSCKGQILNDMNIEGLFSLLFKEPFIKCICDQCMPFLIVIDALDECRQEDRYELVDLITKHFHKLPSYIRFLITTRPEKDVLRKFQSLNPIFLEPDKERNLNDLRVFFENKIETKTEILVENLVKNSEGLMLYASFIAKLFEDNFSISNAESLPKGIEEIYESYFKRLEKDMKKLGIGEDKFSSLLSIVAMAKQPLPMPFIEKLLCPEKDSLSARRMLLQVISCISSLLVVKDDCISIFHKSVKDWLVKPDHFYTIIETDGHKTLADICVNQLQMLKQCEVRFTYDLAIKYSLQYGIPHILEAKIEDKHYLGGIVDNVIDLEVLHSSICIDVHTTLKNLDNLSSLVMYNSLFERTVARIKMLIRIIRKFTSILQVTPQSFLQHVANEQIEKLSSEASALLMTRYKNVAYFEFDNVERKALVGRILTRQAVVEVDISPSEDFVICGYEKKGIELFSLSNFKSLWKIDDFVAERSGYDFYKMLLYETCTFPGCIAFHPFLNIIFPGQLEPVLNLEGVYESGPLTCGKTLGKFKFCCFSHDHTKMVTICKNDLIVWNLRDNKKVITLPCDSSLYSVLFSGNDRYIATTDSSSFKVYDTENRYRIVSRRCDENFKIMVSTFRLDSWYCRSFDTGNGNIVRHDLTNQRVYIDFLLLPRNKRARDEFQAIMENKSPMWLQKLCSGAYFFILGNGSVFFKRNEHELRILKIKELSKGSKLKQEYDNCRPKGSSLVHKESAIISVNGRYIYTSNPYISLSSIILSSTQQGKSWKLVRTEYTPLLPVTNGVFSIKVKKNHVELHGGIPELWNADLTERLFKFSELSGTRHCLSVTENLVACTMKSEVCFFDVVKKEIVACTKLPERSKHTDYVIACGSQYHVVYTRDKNTYLLQKKKKFNLTEHVLINLKPSKKCIDTACFSPGGGLLAFSCGMYWDLIHILDISTYEIRCKIPLPSNKKKGRLEFLDEEHILCPGNFNDCLFLINVKTGDILTSLSVGADSSYEWTFSVCRKTGDVVVLDSRYQELKLFKLWFPQQRRNSSLKNFLLNDA